ncbi:MAG: hypothetical protein WB762_01295 [Candidatus Sulfotelmatobacter sp.]
MVLAMIQSVKSCLNAQRAPGFEDFDGARLIGVLLWEIPHTQELRQDTQQRCRVLLSHLLMAAVNPIPISTEEESSEKVQPSHIAREACVYIRQATMQQVRTRLEGQRRQYDLREGLRHSAFSVWSSLMKIWAAPELARSSVRVSVVCWPQYAQAKWVRYSAPCGPRNRLRFILPS